VFNRESYEGCNVTVSHPASGKIASIIEAENSRLNIKHKVFETVDTIPVPQADLQVWPSSFKSLRILQTKQLAFFKQEKLPNHPKEEPIYLFTSEEGVFLL
jgi:hypothetical protein